MKGWKLFTPLLILAIVAITLYLRLHNPPLLLQGEADATNVIVSSKAKGRVQVLHVRRGDEVKQGDLLISLDSPELEAQLDALHAARNQAQAQLDESLHGTREESIRALKASLAQAEAELRNAESDFQRNQQMVERGFLSRTQFDLSRPRRGPISTKASRATARSAARRCRPRCAGPTRRSPSYRRRSTTCRCARRSTARSGRSPPNRAN